MLLWAFATRGRRRGGARRGRPARRRAPRCVALAALALAVGAPAGAPAAAPARRRPRAVDSPLDVGLLAALVAVVRAAAAGPGCTRRPSSTTRSRITCTSRRPGCTTAASSIVPAVFGDPSPAYAPGEPRALVPVPDGAAALGLPGRRRAAAVRGARRGRDRRGRPRGGRHARPPRSAAALAFLLVPEVWSQMPTAMTDLGLAALPARVAAVRAPAVARPAPRAPTCWPSPPRSASPSERSTSAAALALPFVALGGASPGRARRRVDRARRRRWPLAVAAGDGRLLVRAQRRSSPAIRSTRSPSLGPALPALYGRAEMRAWDYHLPGRRPRRARRDVDRRRRRLRLRARAAAWSRSRAPSARASRRAWLARSAAASAIFWFVIPYQESRFLFAAFGVAAVAIGRAAAAPAARARLARSAVAHRRRARRVADARAPAAARRSARRRRSALAWRRRRSPARRAAPLARAVGRRARPARCCVGAGRRASTDYARARSRLRRRRRARRRLGAGSAPTSATRASPTRARTSRSRSRASGSRTGVALRERRGRARRSPARLRPAAATATRRAGALPARRQLRRLAGATCAPRAREVLFVAALVPDRAPQHRRRRRRLPDRARLGRRPPRRVSPALRLGRRARVYAVTPPMSVAPSRAPRAARAGGAAAVRRRALPGPDGRDRSVLQPAPRRDRPRTTTPSRARTCCRSPTPTRATSTWPGCSRSSSRSPTARAASPATVLLKTAFVLGDVRACSSAWRSGAGAHPAAAARGAGALRLGGRAALRRAPAPGDLPRPGADAARRSSAPRSGRPRALYALVPCGLVWANANSCFFLAPAVLALYALGARLDGRRGATPAARRCAPLALGPAHLRDAVGRARARLHRQPLADALAAPAAGVPAARAGPLDGPFFFVAARRRRWRLALARAAAGGTCSRRCALGLLGARRIRFVAEFALLAAPIVAVRAHRRVGRAPAARAPRRAPGGCARRRPSAVVALLAGAALVPRVAAARARRAASSTSASSPTLVPTAAIALRERQRPARPHVQRPRGRLVPDLGGLAPPPRVPGSAHQRLPARRSTPSSAATICRARRVARAAGPASASPRRWSPTPTSTRAPRSSIPARWALVYRAADGAGVRPRAGPSSRR